MFRNYCLIVISFFLTISAHAKEQYHWQERDFIINSFIDIALQREYDRKQTPRLVRWERPIHIYVESDYGDSQEQNREVTKMRQILKYVQVCWERILLKAKKFVSMVHIELNGDC